MNQIKFYPNKIVKFFPHLFTCAIPILRKQGQGFAPFFGKKSVKKVNKIKNPFQPEGIFYKNINRIIYLILILFCLSLFLFSQVDFLLHLSP